MGGLAWRRLGAIVPQMEIANIGSEGVERRLRNAVTAFGFALLLVVGLRLFHAPPWAFGFLLLPFYASALLVYQGLFKT